MKTKTAMIAAMIVLTALSASGCGRISFRYFAIEKRGEELEVYRPDGRPDLKVAHATFLCSYSTTDGGSVVIPCSEDLTVEDLDTLKIFKIPAKAVGVILYNEKQKIDVGHVCQQEECILESVAIDTNGGVKWQ